MNVSLEQISLELSGSQVLSGLSVGIASGQSVALIGPGGAGKTLILRLMCGLLQPSAGRVEIDGQDITGWGDEALIPLRRRMGMIFQRYALFDALTVFENVAFSLGRGQPLTASQAEAVHEMLARVHLSKAKDRLPAELSGGMRKRVAVARALVHQPALLLCDDPTAGLDPVTTRQIFDLLAEARAQRGMTCVVVSHACGPLRGLCDTAWMVERGEAVYFGPIDDGPAPVRRFLDAGARR